MTHAVLLEDPLNVAIPAGLLMSACGVPLASLGPLADAINKARTRTRHSPPLTNERTNERTNEKAKRRKNERKVER